MARFSSGTPIFYDYHDDGSVSSVSSEHYAHSALTARLPPAVRDRRERKGGIRSQVHTSDYRLSQLEQKLRELEMNDWRTDRLTVAAPIDREDQAWKPDLPPRTTVHDSGGWELQRADPQQAAPAAHRTWLEKEPVMRTPNRSLPNPRLAELSQARSHSNYSFGTTLNSMQTHS